MTIEEQIRGYVLADADVAALTQDYTPYYMEQTTEEDVDAVLQTVVVRMDKQVFSRMQNATLVEAEMQVFSFATVKDNALALAEAIRKRINRKRFESVDYILWLSDSDGFDEQLKAHYQMAVYQVSYFQNQ